MDGNSYFRPRNSLKAPKTIPELSPWCEKLSRSTHAMGSSDAENAPENSQRKITLVPSHLMSPEELIGSQDDEDTREVRIFISLRIWFKFHFGLIWNCMGAQVA